MEEILEINKNKCIFDVLTRLLSTVTYATAYLDFVVKFCFAV